MLACTETVTFIRQVKGTDTDTYTTAVFNGVSWFNKTRIKMENAGMVYDNVVDIRIPAALVGGFMPAVGDYVVHGTVDAITKRSDIEAYKPRKVLTVGDNRRGNLPHVVVIGE